MDPDLLIGMAASIIIGTVKNPARQAKLAKVMLKIFTTIGGAYINNPDFQAAINNMKTTP